MKKKTQKQIPSEEVENKTMKQQIENIIKENLPEKNEIYPINVEKQDEKWNYLNGFNQALSQIDTSLIADEVLKVVVKTEIFKEILEYIRNTEEKIDGEWGFCRDFIELERDKEVPELYYKVKDLLSTLSPNKKNK